MFEWLNIQISQPILYIGNKLNERSIATPVVTRLNYTCPVTLNIVQKNIDTNSLQTCIQSIYKYLERFAFGYSDKQWRNSFEYLHMHEFACLGFSTIIAQMLIESELVEKENVFICVVNKHAFVIIKTDKFYKIDYTSKEFTEITQGTALFVFNYKQSWGNHFIYSVEEIA